VITDKTTHFCEVHIREATVVRPTSCHHNVIYQRQVSKKTLESSWIRSIEGSGPHCINLGGSMLETLGITRCENQLRSLGTRSACCLEANACAPADNHDSLPEEFRFALDSRGNG
jgi:hypothetical protein